MKQIITFILSLAFTVAIAQNSTISLSNIESNFTVLPAKNNHLMIISQDPAGITTFTLRDTLDNIIWSKTDTFDIIDFDYLCYAFPDLEHYLIGTGHTYDSIVGSNNPDSIYLQVYVLDTSANIATKIVNKYYQDLGWLDYFNIVVNSDTSWSYVEHNMAINSNSTPIVQYNLQGDTISYINVHQASYFGVYPPFGMTNSLDNGVLFYLTYDQTSYFGKMNPNNTVDLNFNGEITLSIDPNYWLYNAAPVFFEGSKYLFFESISGGAGTLFIQYTTDSLCQKLNQSMHLLKYNNNINNKLFENKGLCTDDDYVYLVTGIQYILDTLVLNTFDHNFNLLCQKPIPKSIYVRISTIFGQNYLIERFNNGEVKLIPLKGCDSFMGIKEQENNPTISIYPNPTKDKITISGADLKQLKKIEITDLSGKVISKTTINSSNTNEISISVEQLQTGTYFVRLIGENSASSYKIVKE